MSTLLPDNGGTKQYGESVSPGPVPAEGREGRDPVRRRRRVIRIAAAAATVVGVIAIVAALATFPVTTHPYAFSVTTQAVSATAGGLGQASALEYVGSTQISVPMGSVITGTWSGPPGALIDVSIQCVHAEYNNISAANGSYSLTGNVPGWPGETAVAYFLVLSTSPVTVTFAGSYTAPVIN